MPSSPPASNIRAFVQWTEPTVFAGDDIECIITFRNVASFPRNIDDEAPYSSTDRNGLFHSRRASRGFVAGHSRKSSALYDQAAAPPLPPKGAVKANGKGVNAALGHRPALSLNVVSGPVRGAISQTRTSQPLVPPYNAGMPAKGHARSLSIMSLGSETVNDGKAAMSAPAKRPMKTHLRSASLSHAPQLATMSPSALSMPSPRQPSPLYEATTPPILPEGQQASALRPLRRRPGVVSAGSTPQLGRETSLSRKTSETHRHDNLEAFKFPAGSLDSKIAATDGPHPNRNVRDPASLHSSGNRSFSPRRQDFSFSAQSNLNPLTRVMSETSHDGTPRTSSEFYSMSNNSQETLTSELPLQQPIGRLFPKSPYAGSGPIAPVGRSAEPETLMMGYVQTFGSFILDGSLVNAAPFEDVKRKGVQGGGGVVGIERSKRSSGLFGAFGWSHLGESLGGLLGGDEVSSIAQMKASAGSKTIPLLSTPQSLLFVDLRLAPGESRSYSYRFPLPRGLPPSYRGRAIKVSYHLSLGVQRPDGQAVNRIEVPFRVLASYNARGDPLGHDLMSPYILLEDLAQTSIALRGPSSPRTQRQRSSSDTRKSKKPAKAGLEDFLRYTERLLKSPAEANGVLLSPTSPTSNQQGQKPLQKELVDAEQIRLSTREIIDSAILQSNSINAREQRSTGHSTNRFNIVRDGQLVGVVTILRPSYRLGETVTGTINFAARSPAMKAAPVLCHSVLIDLESTEHVDPSLALRSSHSISRVTRKVYASARESCLFARRVGFSLAIPLHATPSFETTGVSLEWRIKIEFTTQRQLSGATSENGETEHDLLEELASDERGKGMIAIERLPVDTFDVSVPLKVYGVVGIDSADRMSAALRV